MQSRPGIAILVTCDYKNTPKIHKLRHLPGTNKDAELMVEAFKHFNYDIHKLQNDEATKTNIIKLLEKMSDYLEMYKYNHLENVQEHIGEQNNARGLDHYGGKVIIFAFSGHGYERDQIFANDGE